jgi:OOP family OmpA-OmpF porin
VPDEAARAAILGKLRELYGAANVVDRLEVGGVVPPPTGPTT